LAYFYVHYAKVPATGGLLYGLKPVVIAIILHAIWSLGKTAISNVWRALLALAAFAASLLGCNLLLVLLLAGLTTLAVSMASEKSKLSQLRQLVAPPALLFAAPEVAAKGVTVGAIFLRFLKLGAVVFGSGYTLVAFLRADLVDRAHWLTSQQLLDAIIVGQVTPGPVFTTATFIGFLLGGIRGAVAATVAIFLPSFIMVAVGAALLPRLQKSRVFSAFIAGVSTASLSLMAAVVVQLAPDALADPLAWVLCLGSAFVLFRYKVNSSILVAVGAAVGLASMWWR
jgi:chromate transporter